MEVQQDFRDLLALFSKHKVDFIIVGAYALGFHGVPRYTGDLDVLVGPDADNADNVMVALNEFGFGNIGLTATDFEKEGNVIQLGFPPIRVDILTSITGITWKQAESGSVVGSFGDLMVKYIGRAEFVANKKALGRKKDIADLEAVGEDYP